jgi:hypothetical protein
VRGVEAVEEEEGGAGSGVVQGSVNMGGLSILDCPQRRANSFRLVRRHIYVCSVSSWERSTGGGRFQEEIFGHFVSTLRNWHKNEGFLEEKVFLRGGRRAIDGRVAVTRFVCGYSVCNLAANRPGLCPRHREIGSEATSPGRR